MNTVLEAPPAIRAFPRISLITPDPVPTPPEKKRTRNSIARVLLLTATLLVGWQVATQVVPVNRARDVAAVQAAYIWDGFHRITPHLAHVG